MKNIVSQLERQLNTIVLGKSEQVRLAIVCMLAEGHLLIEDVPGLGKTTLARAIAGSISGTCNRIQFTPDLMPSDITGVSVFHQTTSLFEFHPGPVFANIVLADEINRASPRTQSALLEVMSERTVSHDSKSHSVPNPFMVVATQNPIEMDGTYPLPEAQLDRFLMQISLGYPDRNAEIEIVRSEQSSSAVSHVVPVVSPDDVSRLINDTASIHASDPIIDYAVRLAEATRSHSDVHIGCSPRASIGLVKSAKALALLEGREYVLPSDVFRLATPVMGHRLILKSVAKRSVDIVGDILSRIPAPPADVQP